MSCVIYLSSSPLCVCHKPLLTKWLCCFLVCHSYENSRNVKVVHVLDVKQVSDSAVSRFRYFHMTYMVKGTLCCLERSWSSHGYINHLYVHDHVCVHVSVKGLKMRKCYLSILTRPGWQGRWQLLITYVSWLCLPVDTVQICNTLRQQEYSKYCLLNVMLHLCSSRSGLVHFLF